METICRGRLRIGESRERFLDDDSLFRCRKIFTNRSLKYQMELSTFGNNNLGIRFDDKNWDPLKAITIDRQGEHQYILRPKVNEVSHRLVVDIKNVDNVKVVTLRSGLLLQNRTLVPLEVAITDSKGKSMHDVSVIHPEADFSVPIAQCYDYWFRIRPKGLFLSLSAHKAPFTI